MKDLQLIQDVDLMINYVAPLCNHLISLMQALNQVLMANDVQYQSAIQELKQCLERVKEEVLAAHKATANLHRHECLHGEIEQLRLVLGQLNERIDKMLSSLNEAEFKKKISELFLPNLQHLSNTLIQRGLDDIRLFRRMFGDFYGVWRKHIHNKDFWLYHGTTVLFLPSIQKNGLDNLKVTKGVSRAISTISDIYARYSIDRAALKGAQDITPDFSKKLVSLAYTHEVLRAARSVGLPTFLYELLNEKNIMEEYKATLLAKLPKADRFMLKAIWRFGRILRARNKMAILHIKVNSDFLNHYDIPDFISHFDNFISVCFPSKPSDVGFFYRLRQHLRETNWSQDALATILRHTNNFDEFNCREVPVRFIYVEVAGIFEMNLMPISKLNETMIKNLVLHDFK